TAPVLPLEPEKKTPSIFHRPEKKTPADQLSHALALTQAGRFRKARRQYRALVHEWHNVSEAADAQFAYAKLLMKAQRYVRAFDEFQYLIDHYAGRFPYYEVLQHQFTIANHLRTVRRGKWFFLPGNESPERALPLFEKIVENGPNWELAHEALYFVGLINQRMKNYQEAISAFEAIQTRYPGSRFMAAACFGRAECLYMIARKAPRDESAYHDALSSLWAFSRSYPNDPNADTAMDYFGELKTKLAEIYFKRAVFYDKQKRPKSALIAYTDFVKRFPTMAMAENARDRIAELETELRKRDEN
ncbi:MAG: tetratricopeptide repeat protein, partial [Lentisphaerae bacterium]|nr:tetratricopeptide repeat protein [Lentisphaerota bacterium]